jgi:putative membrane protein
MKKIHILFYTIFILAGALSISFVEGALSYSGGSLIAIAIISIPSFYYLYKNYGIYFCIRTMVVLSLFALGIEYIGLVTGFPYGEFWYKTDLGYKIASKLPLAVGLSWAPLMIGAVAITYSFTKNKIGMILWPVILLLIFDLVLDPGAVSVGMWEFRDSGSYYNIPVQNFIGWIISGFIGSIISYIIFKNKNHTGIFLASTSMVISMGLWTLIAIFKGMTIPAIIGILFITLWIYAYKKYESNNKN